MDNILLKEKNLVVPLMGINGIHQSDTTIWQNLTDAGTQYKTIKELVTKYQPDGMFAMMDLAVEAEALGLKISKQENETPAVLEHSVSTKDDVDQLRARWKGISGRMPVFIEVVKRMAAELDILIGAHVIGPFTLAGELMGVGELTMNTILDPDFIHTCLDFSVEIISEYTLALFAAGANVVSILEPTAMMISSDHFNEFSAKPFKRILANVNNKPLILHICGNTTHLIESMGKTGAAGLSVDWQVNMADSITMIPQDVALIGNLDPVQVFLNATPDEVKVATRELKETMRGNNNFILSSGCDLPLETPPDNLTAYMKAARE